MNYQKKIISIIIYLTILFGACYSASKEVGSYLIFIDFPSAIIVIIIALAYSFNKSNKIKSFGDGAVYGGWLGFLIGLISMSADFALNQLNIKEFLSANSVLWLIVFYGYCIKFLMKILDNQN
jgi:hypothetical protein|tara:strand:+ start:23 stop:391 length:369 start_codon:yes stop_codon:yes gene_type:complete